MKEIKFSQLIDESYNDEKTKLLNCLNKISKCNDVITTDYIYTKEPLRIYDLLDRDEYIRTRANEVPKEDGGWDYHNNKCSYDLYYILLDNNNLLVVERKASIDCRPGDFIGIRVLLYPNADQFIVKTYKGHMPDIPYINIEDNTGKLISEFYFEMPDGAFEHLNNISLKEAITPVNIERLTKKYQDENQDPEITLIKKQ